MNIEAVTVEVAKLELKPGDRLVVRTRDQLEPQTMAMLAEQLSAALPDTVVLVIQPGTDLTVLTKAEIEARS